MAIIFWYIICNRSDVSLRMARLNSFYYFYKLESFSLKVLNYVI